MRTPPIRHVTLAGVLLTLVLVVLFIPAAQARHAAKASGSPVTPASTPASTQYVPAGCHDTPKQANGVPQAQCYAMLPADSNSRVAPNAAVPPAGALGPAEIKDAYNLPDGGVGQTVAIVDAYGYASAEQDLAVFREHYGLPACTTDNGCFKKVDQRGGTDYPADDAGWAVETALDLDAVSSACPKCHILLVQADSARIDQLAAAVDTATTLGAKFVSNSYGIDGGTPAGSLFDDFYDHPGVAVVVSSGDTGNVVSWPSTNPHVVSAGGTTLTRDSSARGWHETAWGTSSGGPGAGSGCALYEAKPDYQNAIDTQCDMRATADVSAVADPNTGLAVYDTLRQTGWLRVGGTSLASPLVAAMYALAGTPVPDTYPVTYPYHDPDAAAHLTDVTEGANSGCGTVLCQGGPGWDGPTGLGTPNGVAALRFGPHGDITGTVTDAATGQPVAGASITARPGAYATATDAQGHYQVTGALVGSYQLTAHKYGYKDATASAAVEDGQAVTANFALTAQASAVLSGTVTDGSGHGWPLYAKITIDGYPGKPIYTDPATGHYQISLVQADHYTLHVTPVVHGYQTATVTMPFASGDTTKDIKVTVDPQACIAPGYDWNGSAEEFTGWTGSTPKDGWSLSGSRTGWSFDNPDDRPPAPGGDDRFAVADSGNAGHARMDTTLTTPVIDLSGHDAPQLWFDTAYYALADQQNAQVEVSADGGQHWQTVWQAGQHNKIGHTQIDLPQAAGHADVQVRFHYTGRYGWYWAIDNVFLGTHTCVPVDGGLVEGLVTDSKSGDGIPDASITGAGATTRSLATPDDPNQPDGLYRLFVRQTGEQKFTAAASGYIDAAATLTVTKGGIVRHDWSLTPTGG
jgi:hypothetical protein